MESTSKDAARRQVQAMTIQRMTWGLASVVLLLVGCGGDEQATAANSGAAGATSGTEPVATAGSTGTPPPTTAAGRSGAAGATTAGSAGASAPAAAGAPAGGVAGAAATAGAAAPPAGAAGAGAAAGAAAPLPTDTCDRACLLAIMQGYIDALIANDPSTLKVSPMLKYTENGVTSKLGDTVWMSAMTLDEEARLDFADPVEGQVASQFAFQEAGSVDVIYQVRLKVVKGEITEIETMAVRQRDAANGFFDVANMKPEAVFLQPIDPAKRMSRDDLKAITELYLEYLGGMTSASDVPFDESCKRYENGQVTATGLSSFNSQSWSFDVTHRILVVDEEAGITWGMFPFMQSEEPLVVGEAFKIIEGKIMMIQAVMANQPAKAWD